MVVNATLICISSELYSVVVGGKKTFLVTTKCYRLPDTYSMLHTIMYFLSFHGIFLWITV